MILLKTTTEIDQKMLDDGNVNIVIDLGFDEVLVSVLRAGSYGYSPRDYLWGYVSRYQIALAMMEQDH